MQLVFFGSSPYLSAGDRAARPSAGQPLSGLALFVVTGSPGGRSWSEPSALALVLNTSLRYWLGKNVTYMQ